MKAEKVKITRAMKVHMSEALAAIKRKRGTCVRSGTVFTLSQPEKWLVEVGVLADGEIVSRFWFEGHWIAAPKEFSQMFYDAAAAS